MKEVNLLCALCGFFVKELPAFYVTTQVTFKCPICMGEDWVRYDKATKAQREKDDWKRLLYVMNRLKFQSSSFKLVRSWKRYTEWMETELKVRDPVKYWTMKEWGLEEADNYD